MTNGEYKWPHFILLQPERIKMEKMARELMPADQPADRTHIRRDSSLNSRGPQRNYFYATSLISQIVISRAVLII